MRLLPLTVVALALLTACSGGSSSAGGEEDFAGAARRAAPAIPLTPDDLNEDWFRSETAGNFLDQLTLRPACDIRDPRVVFPGAVAAERSDTLEGPAGQQVLTYGAVFPDEATAAASLDAVGRLIEECETDFKDEVGRLAAEQLDALGIDLGFFADIDVSLTPAEVPEAGDDLRAYRLQVTVGVLGQDREFTVDVAALRSGRIAGGLVFAAFGEPSGPQQAALRRLLLAKMEAADAELPGGGGG